jgi:uncharacterized protein
VGSGNRSVLYGPLVAARSRKEVEQLRESIDVPDLDAIALGAPVLATGGGSDPHVGKLIAREAIARTGSVPMIALDSVPNNALVIASASMGAPTVRVEKVPSGSEAVRAFSALEEFLGEKAYATYSIEAGGLNSTIPIGTAAKLGIPLIDADGMGRAFPEIQMVSPSLYGFPATPMAIADEKGNVVILQDTLTNLWTERFARHVTIDMGGSAMIALYPLRGRQAKRALIPGSISFARDIGNSLQAAWQAKKDPIEAILQITRGGVLFRGNIEDVDRRTEAGFARGVVQFRGTNEYINKRLSIGFQNENLIAVLGKDIVASVPDLIAVLDAETGTPVTTERLSYGFRVVVIAIPCHPKWRTKRGLELVGPGFFGYNTPYRPIRRPRLR